jgi:hypothetical protein
LENGGKVVKKYWVISVDQVRIDTSFIVPRRIIRSTIPVVNIQVCSAMYFAGGGILPNTMIASLGSSRYVAL